MKTIFAIILSVASVSVLADSPPEIYSQDGKYLGNLSTNKYDPESVSNPYGRHGNPYSADSINNPYGRYGNPYSNESVNNPYATQAPKIIHRRR